MKHKYIAIPFLIFLLYHFINKVLSPFSLMIHHELKKLRILNKYTLKELSSKIGYGTGNLSSYETGRLKARDATLVRMLTKGYGYSKAESLALIGTWRKEEVEDSYELGLAQGIKKKNKKKITLEVLLKAEGLTDESIKKVKKEIEKYRKEYK